MDSSAEAGTTNSTQEDRMIRDGWCDDCDDRTALIDTAPDGSAWAMCTECGTGWISRDDVPETVDAFTSRSVGETTSVGAPARERRAA